MGNVTFLSAARSVQDVRYSRVGPEICIPAVPDFFVLFHARQSFSTGPPCEVAHFKILGILYISRVISCRIFFATFSLTTGI